MEDQITGSNFMVNEYGIADSITAYISGTTSDTPEYKCVIYRYNDSKLIDITENKSVDETGWVTFSFPDPKAILVEDTEYVLTVWGNNSNAKVYYDGGGSVGCHGIATYGDPPPDPIEFLPLFLSRTYSIYCSYTPETPPCSYEGWEIVAEDGVRNYGGPREKDNRYVWETTTYTIDDTEYLYVGTSSDFDYSRTEPPFIYPFGYGGDPNIYRTDKIKPNLDEWEEVELPDDMTQKREIEYYRGFRSLIEFNNNLYVGVFVDIEVPFDRTGCRLWKYNGTTGVWTHVINRGFRKFIGSSWGFLPGNCHSIRGMEIFNNNLYVGTSSIPGIGVGRLIRATSSNPENHEDWVDVLPRSSQFPRGGFGTAISGIAVLKVFNNQLYAGCSGPFSP
ncbi:unnamed protein product, partial [marine sediment metagenome]